VDGLVKILWHSVPQWVQYLIVWVFGFVAISTALRVFGEPPKPWGAVAFYVFFALWLAEVVRAQRKPRASRDRVAKRPAS